MDTYPKHCWIFLALTVRNCAISDLRDTITAMNRGWHRLLNRKDWPADGWIRAVEVTRGEDGSAHPHFHCLLMVPPSYFGKDHVPIREWVQRWRESMRLDYDPVCDIRVIKPKVKDAVAVADGSVVDLGAALRHAIAELAKYQAKASDLLEGGPEWLAQYIAQIHGTKIITSGGALRGILAKMEKEGGNLVHVDGDKEEGDSGEAWLAFYWHRPRRKYARKIRRS